MVVALAGELPPAAVDAEHVRRVVDAVLSRPEFSDAAPSRVARIRAWVGEQLGRLFEAVADTGQARLIGTLLLTIVILVVVVLAVRYARGLRRDPDRAPVTAGRVGRHASAWSAEADEHERAGHLREALRCHYRALLAELAAAGAVEEAPGRTTGEYLAEARRRHPAVAEHVAAVTAAFEAGWYGGAAVDRASLEDTRRHIAAARAALAAAARAALVDREVVAAGDAV